MKLVHIITIILCVYTPTIQPNIADFLKGTFFGAAVTSSVALIAHGRACIDAAHNIENDVASHSNASDLYREADACVLKGINSIAMGTAIGLVTIVAIYANALTPTSDPADSQNI